MIPSTKNLGRRMRAVILGVAVTLGVCATAVAHPLQPAEPVGAAGSDLRPDPAVHYLTLANGLRIALLPNRTPAHAVSFRLSVRAGSLNEGEHERGLFHFI